MLSALAIAVVLAAPAVETQGFCGPGGCTSAPSAYSEVVALAGVQAQGFGYTGGRTTEPFLVLGAEGRYRPAKDGTFVEHLLIEGGVLGQAPLISGGAMLGAAGVARVGLGFSSFAFTVGANMRLDATPSAFSILPALTVSYRPGIFGVRAGLLDRAGGPLAHIGLDYSNFGIGYVAPLGAEAYARFRLAPRMALDARFYGYSIGTAFSVALLLGFVYGEGLTFETAGST